MSAKSNRPGFTDVPEALVAEALRQYPLAWIACDGVTFLTAAPVVANTTPMIGHLPRSSPLVERFRNGCEATFLFVGPHGYLSPSWLSNPDWAPTWNFVSVQFRAAVRLLDDERELLSHLFELCALKEDGRSGWTPARLGPRLRPLAQRIVAFTAQPLQRTLRFKLGQDERDEVFAELLSALEREPGGAPLRNWMLRLNAWRD